MIQQSPITSDCGGESFLRQFMLMKKHMNGVPSLELFVTIEDHCRLILLL